MKITNINQLKNILDYGGSVEELAEKYEFITIYCVDGNKPFYENVDGRMKSNGAMIDCIVKSQKYTLFINGKSVKQGGDEISWELLHPFLKNKGITYENKFYQFDHADLIENNKGE